MVIRVNKANQSFFHAITVETEDTSYMIKINIKVDSIEELERLENQDDDDGHDDDDDTIAGGEEDIQDMDENDK